jgi:hypothetical protein
MQVQGKLQEKPGVIPPSPFFTLLYLLLYTVRRKTKEREREKNDGIPVMPVGWRLKPVPTTRS